MQAKGLLILAYVHAFYTLRMEKAANTPGLPIHRVLIVDDDEELGELLREFLGREGIEAHLVHNGTEGVERAQSGDYAIMVLDVMMPGIGGFEVLRLLRASGGVSAQLPVLMLTARREEVDRILGLEMGADDYLIKPFSPRELVARLRAIVRRARPALPDETPATPPSSRVVQVGDIALDHAAREVRRGAERIDLTAAEFDLLDILLMSAGEIVTRAAISQAVLGRELLPYDRAIDVHVSNLRRKLGTGRQGIERIKSVRNNGYLFVLPSPSSSERFD